MELPTTIRAARREAFSRLNNGGKATSAPWYTVRNAAGDEAEVLLYDSIGGWDGTTADSFVREFSAITAKTINLRINSEGGDVFDGVAIYNAIDRHSSKVVAHVDGMAASTASWIAMAGDELRMADNAYLMIHNAAAMAWGDAETMRKTADLLDKINGTISDMYAAKSGGTAEEYRKLMAAETWFTAAEAVSRGLADSAGGAPPVASNRALNLSHFQNVPDALRSRARQSQTPPKTVREFENFLRDAAGFSNAQAKAIASGGFKHSSEPRDEADLSEIAALLRSRELLT